MNVLQGFRDLIAHRRVSEKLLVPMLMWASGSERDIELCQRINRKFFGGNRNVYILELSLSNNIEHIIKYPKATKSDTNIDFFYNDVCSFYGWTRRELNKNLNVLTLDELKSNIAKLFGYDNKQRKKIGLEALKKNG